MFSKDAWNALAFSAVVGLITMLILWLLVPPALVTFVAWMIVPRLNAEIEVLPFFLWSAAIWCGAHIALAVLPFLPLTWKRHK